MLAQLTRFLQSRNVLQVRTVSSFAAKNGQMRTTVTTIYLFLGLLHADAILPEGKGQKRLIESDLVCLH
jgi:hypothetical protein